MESATITISRLWHTKYVAAQKAKREKNVREDLQGGVGSEMDLKPLVQMCT